MTQSRIERAIWEPGNATRYVLMYGRWGGSDEAGGHFLNWLNANSECGGVCMVWRGDEVGWRDVCHNLGANRADAAAILAYIRTLGFKVAMPSDFNQDGLWDPKSSRPVTLE